MKNNDKNKNASRKGLGVFKLIVLTVLLSPGVGHGNGDGNSTDCLYDSNTDPNSPPVMVFCTNAIGKLTSDSVKTNTDAGRECGKNPRTGGNCGQGAMAGTSE